MKLGRDGGFGFAVFTLECGFADAKNWCDAITDGGGDLFANVFFAFVENIATLGMTNNGVIDKATNLRNGSFASEGAKIAPVEILGCKFELATINLQREWLQRNSRRSKDNLNIA